MDHVCNICLAVFKKGSNWRRHLEEIHKFSKEEIKKSEVKSKRNHPSFIWCKECNRALKARTREGLRSHAYKIHQKTGTEAQNFIAELEKANSEKLDYLRKTQVRIVIFFEQVIASQKYALN